MYREALQAMLRCPKCGEMNVPKASPTVVIQEGGETAECSNCSCSGSLSVFLPKETK